MSTNYEDDLPDPCQSDASDESDAPAAEPESERLCKQCGRPVGWENDYCAGCAG